MGNTSEASGSFAGTGGLAELSSSQSSLRLNLIDRIRSKGVGNHISLPQLVVCGDQSAGKSSVLTGLTGIPFPRQDGACTRFATQISLRHSSETFCITARISPQQGADPTVFNRLKGFVRQLTSFDDLPQVITDAGELMGVQSSNEKSDGRGFSGHMLCLDVSGPTGLHLTVVDLPGLISVDEEDQTNVEVISDLVNAYIMNPRTIILAVVQAGNDIQNQSIIQRAKQYDREGLRTIGIITKPDLINEGTESRIARLSRNEDTTKLKLGFFVVKSPSPAELLTVDTHEERRKCEAVFFESNVWKNCGLNQERVGIDHLRAYLQRLLHNHIERELPKVRKEIEDKLFRFEKDLRQLGGDRSTASQQRSHLIRIAMEFHDLVRSALEGTYGRHQEFFDSALTSSSSRLRAEVHEAYAKFATAMRQSSKRVKCSEDTDTNPDDEDADMSTEIEDMGLDCVLVSNKEYRQWVRKLYSKTRGLELSGNPNYVLIFELFRQQSSLWRKLAKEHLGTLSDILTRFIDGAFEYVVKDISIRSNLHGALASALQSKIDSGRDELDKLLEDEQRPPITYNHYYTDNLQDSRNKSMNEALDAAINSSSGISIRRDKSGYDFHSIDVKTFTSSLHQCLKVVDMEEHACNEAVLCFEAYYKVAMKTFVDNVCRQVGERHLFSGLADVLSIDYINGLTDEELDRIAAEPEETKRSRKELQADVAALREGLQELRKSSL